MNIILLLNCCSCIHENLVQSLHQKGDFGVGWEQNPPFTTETYLCLCQIHLYQPFLEMKPPE